MIRFCDGDVGCAEYDLLSRKELLSYFLAGHLDEIVSVYDSSNMYVGIVTYYSLLYSISIDAAICREYVLLDDDVWMNAREIFKTKSHDVHKLTLLPVLDKDYQLICFAYQDEDANREIRMLRELLETEGVLQFTDVFPNYQCVKIHEFNELAFLFAEYVRKQNIMVHVKGAMWQGFFESAECQAPEYECLNIYAEGTWEKTHNWKENLLRSVSVEFECIDKVYEANIENNLIKDAAGDYTALLERLRGEDEVILCGTDMRAQDAYDFLVGNGIEVSGFAVDELNARNLHKIFGKRILGLSEALCTCKAPIFIDCTSRHSAWGFGRVDFYDYIGCKRNERFFMLRDYIEVPASNLLNSLRDKELVLTGDRYLCNKLYGYFMQKNILVAGYLAGTEENYQAENMPEWSGEVVHGNLMGIIVVPICRNSVKKASSLWEELMQRRVDLMAYLGEKQIDNVTDYFSNMIPFINIEKETRLKYAEECWKPKKIVVGTANNYSGNDFFKSLLDSHPSILYMDYCDLNYNLFWICVRLSTECAENILPLFWKFIEGNEESIVNRTAFTEKMQELLARKSKFTSQELFVMLHVAYMRMFEAEPVADSLRNKVIYWEPHFIERNELYECVEWLGTEEIPCDTIKVVRNSVQQKGTTFKAPWCIEGGVRKAYYTALQCLYIDRKVYEYSDKLVVRFEDLKCHPADTLREVCDRWGIEWSDLLMQTTRRGQEHRYTDAVHTVSGFDLGPVYNSYENFFSEFDRLRLTLVHALWQKEYGYSYVDPNQFARKELQEMFLKEFRFEDPGDSTGFYKNRLNLDDRIGLQDYIRYSLHETRCLVRLNEVKG